MSFKQFDLIPGNIIENFVFLNLRENFNNIFYYRTISKAEIDFIVRETGHIVPIEVKFSKKPKVPVKTFSNFRNKYKNKLSIIITKESFLIEKDIIYIPVLLLPFIDLRI